MNLLDLLVWPHPETALGTLRMLPPPVCLVMYLIHTTFEGQRVDFVTMA